MFSLIFSHQIQWSWIFTSRVLVAAIRLENGNNDGNKTTSSRKRRLRGERRRIRPGLMGAQGSTKRKRNHGAKFQRKQEQDNSREGGICTTYARTEAKGLNNFLTWSDACTGNLDDRTLTQCSVDDGRLDEWTADMGKRIIEWYLNKFAHDGIGFVFWTKYYRMT